MTAHIAILAGVPRASTNQRSGDCIMPPLRGNGARDLRADTRGPLPIVTVANRTWQV